jgi:hypothetical protein
MFSLIKASYLEYFALYKYLKYDGIRPLELKSNALTSRGTDEMKYIYWNHRFYSPERKKAK